jgi:hypothetical protein
MWEQAIAAAAECILEGLARAKRCTIEGRSAMSLDLSNVEKTLRGVAPQHINVNLRVVDNYIKVRASPQSFAYCSLLSDWVIVGSCDIKG